MLSIFIRISVPFSATPQGAVEWLEPTARTGAGYFTGSFITATMSSTLFASTMTWGWETIFPNQFVTVFSAIALPRSRDSRVYMRMSVSWGSLGRFSGGAPEAKSHSLAASCKAGEVVAEYRQPFRKVKKVHTHRIKIRSLQ